VTDGSAKATKNFKDLSHLSVYVGIPESSPSRKGGKITQAELAYILTHGTRTSDARRIVGASMLNRGIDFGAAQELYIRSHGAMAFNTPPAPIIEPAIEAEDNKAAIVAELKNAATKQLDGDHPAAVNGMKRAGQEAVNRVKAWFYDNRNNWPPNAPSTIKRKGSSRRNIDTGSLRDAMTFVIGEDK
jgi:hypothetical protein